MNNHVIIIFPREHVGHRPINSHLLGPDLVDERLDLMMSMSIGGTDRRGSGGDLEKNGGGGGFAIGAGPTVC